MESTCASRTADKEKKEQEMFGSGRKLQNVELKETGHTNQSFANKVASQIKKPSHRRSPPLTWFPRKKTDSFLKRKIKLLQEGGGMSSSLVETLGNANPHYSRIAREKIAAQEAASKAMEACKAAMVEASWCRILQAARIQSKDAESKLEQAESHAAEAFEEAKLMGIMMFDRPDCHRRSCDVASLSTGGKSEHTVTASFETEFQVDREVAAVVKKALIILANSSSSSNNKEFRDLLQKIRRNPDDYEALTASPQREFYHSGSEICEKPKEMSHRKSSCGILPEGHQDNSSNSPEDLVYIMVDRLKELQEDELSSLATIVATCGLNAALLEMQGGHDNKNEHDAAGRVRRKSNVNQFAYGSKKKKEDINSVPSLDKFLVKHVSRLEREVQQAQMSKKDDNFLAVSQLKQATIPPPSTSDLGSILIKHVSKLEKEVQEAKKSQKQRPKNDHVIISGSIPYSRGKKSSNHGLVIDDPTHHHEEKCIIKSSDDLDQPDVELLREITNGNIFKSDCNKKISHDVRANLKMISHDGSDIVIQKKRQHVEKMEKSLDEVLVKHRSKLERAKIEATQNSEKSIKIIDARREARERELQETWGGLSLGNSLRPHLSKLEKDKVAWRRAEQEEKIRRRE